MQDRRIGVFGGTFDPVHIGHLRTAQEVLERLDLPDFRFLPAGDPPHRGDGVTGARHRLAMLELALEGHPRFSIDRRELRRPGPSFMVDTLSELRVESPGSPILLIIGQDSANGLASWHRWREIFGLAHVVIMRRPGHDGRYENELGKELETRIVTNADSLAGRTHGLVLGLEVTQLPVSSSAIRALFRSGHSARYLVPEKVRTYILDRGLYGSGAG